MIDFGRTEIATEGTDLACDDVVISDCTYYIILSVCVCVLQPPQVKQES